MQENNMQREDIRHPINDYDPPKTLNRFSAVVLDLAIYVFLSFLILTLAGFIASRSGGRYKAANNLISDHIKYSKLAKDGEKNGYVSYSGSDMLVMEEDEPLIINRLSYFYLSYLTGENVDTNYEASLNKDDYIKVDGINYLPKEYYNVQFFNEKILKIKEQKEGQEFFKYQQTDGHDDESKIAILGEAYIEETTSGGATTKKVKGETELVKLLNSIYNDAIKVFYGQAAIKKASHDITQINIILMLISTMPSFLILFVLLPLLDSFGRTLGKRLFSIIVVSDKGYQVKKWQMLLRSVPIFAATIYVCLINSLYFQFLLPFLLVMISAGFAIFNPRRRALHDFMAATTAIKADKSAVIFPDEEHYQKALAIMKERDEALNGQE